MFWAASHLKKSRWYLHWQDLLREQWLYHQAGGGGGGSGGRVRLLFLQPIKQVYANHYDK